MRKILQLIIIALLSTSIVSPVFASEPSEPHAADAMWIEPSTLNVPATEGYKFNVTVWVNLTITCGAWEIKLIYNKNYLNATRIGLTAGTTSEFFQGKTIIPVPPGFGSVNATHDYVLYGEAILSPPYREPGYGSLCWIEFEVTNAPPEGEVVEVKLDISTYANTSPPETYVLDENGEKVFPDIYDALAIIPEMGMLTIVVTMLIASAILVVTKKKFGK